MARNTVGEWSETASNNTDVGGINIAEACQAANVNNALREIMAQIARTGLQSFEVADFDGLIADGNTYDAGSIVDSADGTGIYQATATTGNLGQTNAGGQEFDVLLNGSGYSVRAFGAKGDATTDDAAAINTALALGNTTVVLQPGDTYRITSTLSPAAGTVIIGYGARIVADDQSFIDGITVAADDVSIYGLEISANTGEDAFDHGILKTSGSRMVVQDCKIDNIGETDTPDTEGHGISVTGDGDKILNNYITNIKGFGDTRGDFIYAINATNLTITGNRMKTCQRQGIALVNGTSDVLIADNIIEDAGLAGIDVEPNVGGDATDIIITGNIIRNFGNQTTGIGSQYHGIDCRSDRVEKVVISNNIITAESANSVTCVRCQNNAAQLVFSNNHLDCNNVCPKGYELFSGGGADKISISGGQVINWTDKAIDASGTDYLSVVGVQMESDETSVSGLYVLAISDAFVAANNTILTPNSTAEAIRVQNATGMVSLTGNMISVDTADAILIRQTGGVIAKSVIAQGNSGIAGTATGFGIQGVNATGGNVTLFTAYGNLFTGFSGDVDIPWENKFILPGLPTSAPSISGQLWSNSGDVTVVA